MLIDTLTAKLTADASGFTPVMERAGLQLRGFQGHGEAAGHGLNAVRRGFEALAIQATGVSGPLGRISTGLLTLGAGSTVVLGVVAGIGLIAGAYKLASAELNHFNDLTDKAIEGAAKFLNAPHQAAVAARAAVAGQLRDAIEELKRSATPTAIVGRGGIITGYAPPNVANVIAAQTAVHALQFELQQADAAVKRLERSMRESSGPDSGVAKMTDQMRAQQRALRDFIEERMQIQADLRNATIGERGLTITGQMSGPLGDIGGGHFLKIPDITKGFGGIDKKMAGLDVTTKSMETELKERGAEIGAAFVMAIAQGANNAADFLKQVMLQIAGFAITKIFKLALGIASPSTVGIDIGKNFSYGLAMGVASGGPAVSSASGAVAGRLAGTAAFSLNLSGMPPAMNSLAAARDQDWQRLFRETSLVAQGSGFRLA